MIVEEAIQTPTVPLPTPKESWENYELKHPELTEEERASAFIEVNRMNEVPAVSRFALDEAKQWALDYEVGADDGWRAVWGFRLTKETPPYTVAYRQGWLTTMSELKMRLTTGEHQAEWSDLSELQRLTNVLLNESFLGEAEVKVLGGDFTSPFGDEVKMRNKGLKKLNKEPKKGHLKLLTFPQVELIRSNIIVQGLTREFNYLPVKPSELNPYAMQPWTHQAFSPGTRGYKGIASQGAAQKRALWMAKFDRWFALTPPQALKFSKKYGGPTPDQLLKEPLVRQLLAKAEQRNPFRRPTYDD